jgi:hypothetical protein
MINYHLTFLLLKFLIKEIKNHFLTNYSLLFCYVLVGTVLPDGKSNSLENVPPLCLLAGWFASSLGTFYSFSSRYFLKS